MEYKNNLEKAISILEKEGYTYVGKTNTTGKYLSKCKNGTDYVFYPYGVIRGRRCPCEKCTGKMKWTEEKVKPLVEKAGNKFISIETVKGRKHVRMICKNGTETLTRGSALKDCNFSCRCEKCTGIIRWDEGKIKALLESKGYTFLSSYRNDNQKLMFTSICPNGHEYTASVCHFAEGHMCDKCNLRSSGELIISDVLSDMNVRYEREYRFPDCRYKNTLPFDFAIFDNEGKLILLIEYDGQQHYKPVDFCSHGYDDAVKRYELQKLKDEIKSKYCDYNNIPLIRIPYTINRRRSIQGYLTIKSRGIGIRLW